MKKSLFSNYIFIVLAVFLISIFLTDCKKLENPVKFPVGAFPDTVLNMADINSIYDDYNVSLHVLYGDAPIIFSSNRKSTGGQFDLEQALISFQFDQTVGTFGLEAQIIDDLFLSDLIDSVETPRNDFGPFRLFNSIDGYEYLIISSENEAGDLDLSYFKNYPAFDNALPDILGPFPVKVLNTDFNDAYISLNSSLDSAYFTSDRDGVFDIYLQEKPLGMEISEWFDSDYSASTKIDNVNSSGDDKCPLVFGRVMFFASDRPGGLGGFDLYYSIFSNGNWGSPVNLGPDINTSSDEYRPVVGYHPDFSNLFMMFSSDRPGGLGGFDLYFAGIEYPG